jgi:hypothetical protein
MPLPNERQIPEYKPNGLRRHGSVQNIDGDAMAATDNVEQVRSQ